MMPTRRRDDVIFFFLGKSKDAMTMDDFDDLKEPCCCWLETRGCGLDSVVIVWFWESVSHNTSSLADILSNKFKSLAHGNWDELY